MARNSAHRRRHCRHLQKSQGNLQRSQEDGRSSRRTSPSLLFRRFLFPTQQIVKWRRNPDRNVSKRGWGLSAHTRPAADTSARSARRACQPEIPRVLGVDADPLHSPSIFAHCSSVSQFRPGSATASDLGAGDSLPVSSVPEPGSAIARRKLPFRVRAGPSVCPDGIHSYCHRCGARGLEIPDSHCHPGAGFRAMRDV